MSSGSVFGYGVRQRGREGGTELGRGHLGVAFISTGRVRESRWVGAGGGPTLASYVAREDRGDGMGTRVARRRELR